MHTIYYMYLCMSTVTHLQVSSTVFVSTMTVVNPGRLIFAKGIIML